MELDHTTLKELGVNKVGDRVRINSQAKAFRNTYAKRASKRTVNRHSLAILDSNAQTSPSSASPRAAQPSRLITSRIDKRQSRLFDNAQLSAGSYTSRPSSPLVDQEARSARSARYPVMSPVESGRREQGSSYFGANSSRMAPPKSASSASDTPQTARFPNHIKSSPSVDNLGSLGALLPPDKPLIRVIYDTARSSVVSIESCRHADDNHAQDA